MFSAAKGVSSECKEAWLKLRHLVWCSFIQLAFGRIEHQAKTRSQTFFTLSTHFGTFSSPYFVIKPEKNKVDPHISLILTLQDNSLTLKSVIVS
jgi:hypothetical protein